MLLAAFGLDRIFAWTPLAHSVWLAAVLAMAGIALDVWAWFGFTLAGTEIMPASVSNKTLVTRGPFGFSRNPMYLGLILLGLGIAFYEGTPPFFLVPVLLFLLCNGVFIPFEEAKMRRQFGNQYTEYTARVRRWI